MGKKRKSKMEFRYYKMPADETHFRRLFSSCMSMGPLEYINLVRVQNACELLRKTDTLVSEIAFRCGFSTLSTFNRNYPLHLLVLGVIGKYLLL